MLIIIKLNDLRFSLENSKFSNILNEKISLKKFPLLLSEEDIEINKEYPIPCKYFI